MSEFKTYTLEQLCIVGSSKRVHLSDYVQQGVPFYRSKEVIEISSGKNISEQLFISSEKYSEIKSKFPVPQENDVLITAVGTIGEILVVKNPNFYFKDGNLIWLRNINFDIIDIDYLYYFFKSDLFQKTIKYNNIGAVQKALTIDFLKTVKITLPSLDNQRKLVSVLKSIDKKIQINNQINQELEAMAKTLYDYWFVQFDFTDQNGKPYKSSGGKMVYNPEFKREIPEGWGVDSLWNIANFYNGLAMQKYRPDTNEDDYLPVIKIREMMNGFSKDTEKARLDIPTEAVVERGDILFSWSATLEVIIWGKERGALNQHIFKVTSDTYPKSFIYFELKSYLKVFKAIAELRKTTMGHITQDHLKQAKIVVPPIELISKLDAKLQPIMLKQQILENQNQELTQLRDWLLPMLMNGQVKVE